MKKIILLIVISVVLFSCGNNKKNSTEVESSVTTDKYSIVMDAIYEKDDSVKVIYKTQNYYQYDKPTFFKVKGSPLMQRLFISLPEGIAAENFTIIPSTNKTQDYLTIKNISIMDDKKLVADGDNYKHSEFFNTDSSFSWDTKNLRYNLNHTNQYPPAMVGTQNLESLMVK
jgi:hypothetical protein